MIGECLKKKLTFYVYVIQTEGDIFQFESKLPKVGQRYNRNHSMYTLLAFEMGKFQYWNRNALQSTGDINHAQQSNIHPPLPPHKQKHIQIEQAHTLFLMSSLATLFWEDAKKYSQKINNCLNNKK